MNLSFEALSRLYSVVSSLDARRYPNAMAACCTVLINVLFEALFIAQHREIKRGATNKGDWTLTSDDDLVTSFLKMPSLR